MGYRFILFCFFSIFILAYSWKSLGNPRRHGFFRFFAFETILILILLNLGWWFRNPFSITQLVSWFFLILSIFLPVHGFYLLMVVGKPRGNFEDTTVLVTRGAYRYIRHPLYCSLICITLGAYFKHLSLATTALTLGALVFLYATARMEEYENLEHFGEEYARYMEKTRMFIPFVF